jgi:rare lipoprotein A
MHTEPSRARGVILSCLIAAAVAIALSATPARADQDTRVNAKVGNASWYGHEFGNRRTASGERFDPTDLTGAHRTLPLGTRVRVTNLRNGRSVLLTITDRGPFRRLREIDVSLGAARLLGMVQRGIERVLIEPLT